MFFVLQTHGVIIEIKFKPIVSISISLLQKKSNK